jgi:hypothetical protein
LKEFDIERVEGVKCLSRLSTIASRRDTKKRSNLALTGVPPGYWRCPLCV